MQQHPLGTSDIYVSQLGLGSMTWGEQNTQAQAHAQMDYALAQGINFFDTAEMYPVPAQAQTQGLTEQYIGSWLKQHHRRDKIILASKVAGPGMAHVRGGSELSPSHIEQAIESSLSRLNTDYIDLYQLHWPARASNFFGQLGYQGHNDESSSSQIEAQMREVLLSLHKLIQQGKIRHYGLSNETPWGVMKYQQLAQALNMPAPVSIQNPYNLLNRTYEIGLAEVSLREQIGLLAYSPLAFGVLSGKYLSASPKDARLTLYSRFSRYSNELAQRATQHYVQLAQEVGIRPTHLALAFINQQKFVTSNIIGATTMQQLAENIDSIQLQLEPEVLDKIEKIHQTINNPCP